MNCRGDDDVDAKRSRPSIGKTPLSATRGKNACFWLGLDQRITSGPAAIAAALKGRIHGCTRTLRRTSDSSCIAGAVHTWHLATDLQLGGKRSLSQQSGHAAHVASVPIRRLSVGAGPQGPAKGAFDSPFVD